MAFKDGVDVQNPTVVELFKIVYEDASEDHFTSYSRQMTWQSPPFTSRAATREPQ